MIPFNSLPISWSITASTYKESRVYVPGDKIAKIYEDNETYYFNPKTGKYKLASTEGLENLLRKYPTVYEEVDGQFIIKKYLEGDIEETLTVDEEFNQASFLLSSMIPTTYERASTMGTATLWKMLMLTWSYKKI